MNKYYGTYLRYNEKDDTYNFTISSDLYMNGSLSKATDLFIYGVAKQNLNESDIESGDIQLYITPYDEKDLKNIYWFELFMENKPGSLLRILDIFNNSNLNILDCTGVDTADESIGKSRGILEVIAKYNGYSYDDDCKEIKDIAKDNKLSFKDQAIIDSDYRVVARCKLLKKNLINDKGEYKLTIPKTQNWTKFNNLISKSQEKKVEECRYLTITSFSEGNFITVKFKSVKEKVISISVPFPKINKNSDTELLYKIIKALWNLGVDMRFVSRHETTKNEAIYDIRFNIAEPGLDKLDKNEQKKIIITSINKEVVGGKFKISNEKEGKIILCFDNQDQNDDEDSTTSEKFREKREQKVIGYLEKNNYEYIKRLEHCNGCGGYNSKDCWLKKTEQINNIKRLLSEIKKVKWDIDIPVIEKALFNLKFDDQYNKCNINVWTICNFYEKIAQYAKYEKIIVFDCKNDKSTKTSPRPK